MERDEDKEGDAFGTSVRIYIERSGRADEAQSLARFLQQYIGRRGRRGDNYKNLTKGKGH